MAGWIQDLALSMLAAEVAAEQRRALQQRLRHQIKEASGQLQEGAKQEVRGDRTARVVVVGIRL